jgi:SAM-dependent methyltransferase
MEQRPVSAWELADLATPWAVHVAVTLRLAEHIQSGVTGIEELAKASGADEYMLHRLLTHLASRGVFEEPEPARFALNPAAEALLDPGARLGLDLDGLGGRFAHAWGGLLDLVRTGQSGYDARFGLPFWDDLHAQPELAADFDALMGPEGHGVPSADIPLVDGWDGVRTVIDVGGGTGTMLAEILRARPVVRGTLVDLPATVERSKATFEVAGVADRATAVGQSFFSPLPSGADIYLLRGVINDWPDAEAQAILRRCAEAARPSGRVVVIGGVLPDGQPRGLSIEMILLGGKNRSVSEFRLLARDAGL